VTQFTGTRRKQRSELFAAILHQRCNPSGRPNYRSPNAFPAVWQNWGRRRPARQSGPHGDRGDSLNALL